MTVKSALLYPNLHKSSCAEAVGLVAEKLSSLGIRTIMTTQMRNSGSSFSNIKADLFLDEQEAFANSDIAVVLGGDGTMLTAAHTACITSTPLLGINLGTLGYMSELEITELDHLEKLKKGFECQDRMMIDIKVVRNGDVISSFTALNEALISKGAVSSMVRLSLACDGVQVNRYRADGLIISTPTGSSAYCLAAGGPIIDTKLDAFCVCPICSHSLSGSKPLVFSPDSVLEVKQNSEKGGDILLTADGRYTVSLEESDVVTVTKSERKTTLIKLKKYAFYETLNRKLGYNP